MFKNLKVTSNSGAVTLGSNQPEPENPEVDIVLMFRGTAGQTRSLPFFIVCIFKNDERRGPLEESLQRLFEDLETRLSNEEYIYIPGGPLPKARNVVANILIRELEFKVSNKFVYEKEYNSECYIFLGDKIDSEGMSRESRGYR